MKKVIDTQAQSITFTFDEGLEPIVLTMSQVSPANATYAMLHGFAARCGDKAAIQKSAENGFKVTEAMRREAVAAIVAHYATGTEDWEMKAAAARPTLNPRIMELAQKRNCSYDEALAWFNEKLMAELSAE